MSASGDRIVARLRPGDGCARGALLPYFTAGFPDSRSLAELIHVADALGVAAVEIGFPYSDSIADGPVIQESFYRALEHGCRVHDAFSVAAQVRSRVACALLAMVSYSIVYRYGRDRFLTEAAAAGFDGVIIPDLPVEECHDAAQATARVGLCHIGMVAPTTTPARREAIARSSAGFVYQVAVAGTTGERVGLPPELPGQVRELRRISGLPVCVGFGIGSAQQVRAVCDVADGAIVGSALVRRVGEAAATGVRGGALAERVRPYLAELMSGIRVDT
ncbi:MAG TPA: tryptophan synthase subunit alpha [Phycisphaerae bacterium]|nr:tryptophan synthase subunit alpha [Phycisphaerae bacterium]HNU45477.1 tryptophan synthase subunit alpha [Phycisphaerae bacterium]